MFLGKRGTKEYKKQIKGYGKWRVPPAIFPKLSSSMFLSLSPTLPPINFEPRVRRTLVTPCAFDQQFWSVLTRQLNRSVEQTTPENMLCQYVADSTQESHHLTLFSSILASSFHAWAPQRIHLATPFDCHDYIHFSFFFIITLFSSLNNTLLFNLWFKFFFSLN